MMQTLMCRWCGGTKNLARKCAWLTSVLRVAQLVSKVGGKQRKRLRGDAERHVTGDESDPWGQLEQ